MGICFFFFALNPCTFFIIIPGHPALFSAPSVNLLLLLFPNGSLCEKFNLGSPHSYANHTSIHTYTLLLCSSGFQYLFQLLKMPTFYHSFTFPAGCPDQLSLLLHIHWTPAFAIRSNYFQTPLNLSI